MSVLRRAAVGRTVDFVDTSILTNILEVPGKCQMYQEIREELIKRQDAGTTFVLPTATIIETGNHVVHLKDGDERRRCATKYAAVLRMTAQGSSPWTLFERTWSDEFLHALCDGASTGIDLVEHAPRRQLGAGDLSIVAERNMYAAQYGGHCVRIWSIDGPLGTWAEVPPQRSGDRTQGRVAGH